MGDKTCDVSLNFVSSSAASPNVPCGAPALASDAWSHPSASNAKFMGPVAVGTSNAIDPFAITDRLARPEALLHRQIEVRGWGRWSSILLNVPPGAMNARSMLPREFHLLNDIMQHSNHLLKRGNSS